MSFTTENESKPLNFNNVPNDTNGKKKEEKRRGCGYAFDWNTAKRSKEVEEKLREIFGVGNYEEIKLEMNSLKKEHKSTFDELDKKLKETQTKVMTDSQ
jgi:hypothetical protein